MKTKQLLTICFIGVFFTTNSLAQNRTNFRNKKGLYIVSETNRRHKISKRTQILFIYNKEVNDSLMTQKVVTGYVQNIIDENTIVVLPVSSRTNIYKENKLVEFSYHSTEKGSLLKPETIATTEIENVIYRPKFGQVVSVTLISAGIFATAFSVVTLFSVPDDKNILNDSDLATLRVSKRVSALGVLLLQTTYLASLLNKHKFRLNPSQDVEKKEAYYHFEIRK